MTSPRRTSACLASLPRVVPVLLMSLHVFAFVTSAFSPIGHCRSTRRLASTSARRLANEKRGGSVEIPGDGLPERMTAEEDAQVQWDLFRKHHALGSWRGTWNTHNYMGDVIDSTVASVDLDLDPSGTSCAQTHKIVAGSVQSDCETCFDSDDVKSFPVAQYSLGNIGRNRLASVGMVIGPSLLRSGAMSTELILRHGDGRVRVVFQHAPVWEAGVEPGSCPPQGLKLFRTMVSREALRSGPPTASAEEADPPKPGNPKFFRGVPPFHWHKRWAGTSWTWGPTTGDRGWSITEMGECGNWRSKRGNAHLICSRNIVFVPRGVFAELNSSSDLFYSSSLHSVK